MKAIIIGYSKEDEEAELIISKSDYYDDAYIDLTIDFKTISVLQKELLSAVKTIGIL